MPTMSDTHGRTMSSGRVSMKTRSSYSSKRNVDEKVLQSAAHSPWDGLSLRQQVTPSAVHTLKEHPYPVYLDIEANAHYPGDDCGDLEHFDSKYVEGFGAQFDGEHVNNPALTSFAGGRAPASRDVPGVGGSKDLLFTLQNNRKSLSSIPAKSRGGPALSEARNAGKKSDDVGPKSESSRHRAHRTAACLPACTTQRGYRTVPEDDGDVENNFGHSSSYVKIAHEKQR